MTKKLRKIHYDRGCGRWKATFRTKNKNIVTCLDCLKKFSKGENNE